MQTHNKLLDLKQLGARLAQLDPMILKLIGLRMDLTDQVGAFKRSQVPPGKIFRPDIEDDRIKAMQTLASELGLDPALNVHFIGLLFYSIINESCKRQMILFQKEEERLSESPDEDEYTRLKANLLILTKLWAPSYDGEYERHAFATRAYLEFERTLLTREVGELTDHSVAVDVGCATGRTTFFLANSFDQVHGLDLSPDMVQVAETKAVKQGLSGSATFYNADVEVGIPLPDTAASFVVMNFGTASDVHSMEVVLGEILRVLKPGGRFLLSFYNSEALVYEWEFIPWPIGLVASINKHKDCLDVRTEMGKVSIYARRDTVGTVRELFRKFGIQIEVVTYPTISAILPDDLFEGQPKIQEAIAAIDRTLASSVLGAYIIATGAKP